MTPLYDVRACNAFIQCVYDEVGATTGRIMMFRSLLEANKLRSLIRDQT
jgi:hypothetical protein